MPPGPSEGTVPVSTPATNDNPGKLVGLKPFGTGSLNVAPVKVPEPVLVTVIV